MIPHHKVHPVEDTITQKNMELGPCIVITPRNLDAQNQNADEGTSLYYKPTENEEKLEADLDKDDASVRTDRVKIQSPEHTEHKVNVNYSYNLHSPHEVAKEDTHFGKLEEKLGQFLPRKFSSFSSNVKPVVQRDDCDKDWRRKSVVSKDFSTGFF